MSQSLQLKAPGAVRSPRHNHDPGVAPKCHLFSSILLRFSSSALSLKLEAHPLAKETAFFSLLFFCLAKFFSCPFSISSMHFVLSHGSLRGTCTNPGKVPSDQVGAQAFEEILRVPKQAFWEARLSGSQGFQVSQAGSKAKFPSHSPFTEKELSCRVLQHPSRVPQQCFKLAWPY